MILSIILFFVTEMKVSAETKKQFRKTQEVNFEGSDVDGQARNPDGDFLLDKKGVKFMPLYKVDKHFDSEIKNSVDYLR